ncbi:MAG: hypothetical protein ACI8ZM_002721 [Crocinitomix sp.]|jgi:hypothetical protein
MSRLERKNSFLKKMAIFMVFNMVFEIVAPTAAMALTSGPSSPEFGSFEPVATNNMVDPFSGDFTYNLPVLMVPGTNGGGYPISLSYHSGTTGEQEASWVGHGWTLNPGAINRGKQGFPDDWNGETVKNHNKAIPNITLTAGINGGTEIFSNGLETIGIDASLNASITYNNYKGFGYSTGAGLSLNKGLVSTGFNITDGQHSFSLRVDPWKLLGRSKKNKKDIDKERDDELSNYDPTNPFSAQIMSNIYKSYEKVKNQKLKSGGVYGIVSLSGGQKANQISNYEGGAFNFSMGFFAPVSPLPAGLQYGFSGSVAVQENVPVTTNAVYGNQYVRNAYSNDNNLMDYYTEKQHNYENNDVFLGIPHALTDQYLVSGEGISGAFRMHHKAIGQYRPNQIKSEIEIGNLGFEFAGGANNDLGGNAGVGYHVYKQQGWELHDGEELFSGNEEGVFRFASDLGGHVEFDNDEIKESAELYKNSGVPGFKKFTADVAGIDQRVNSNSSTGSYDIGASSYIGHNTFEEKNLTSGTVHYRSYEKSEHIEEFIHYDEPELGDQIAELSVKNKNGESYNYGLPVFARNEKDISIGLTGITPAPIVQNGYMVYADADVSTAQNREDLKIIQGQEREAPYVTSYLLTSINEPNYIDRTNDGPTEDDFGGYTKFEYTQAYGSEGGDQKSKLDDGNWYDWRYPYAGLYYDRGRLSDKKDDLGTYSSGEKEVYYLENIETKTHIAVFETSARMDGLSANPSAADASLLIGASGDKQLQKLDKIELFVKDAAWEAYVADNSNPKPAPLKTVNFDYDYTNVPGIPNSDNGGGKLTLTRVWFDYNGVYKAQISPYEFEYNYPNYDSYPAKYTAGDDDVTAGYADFYGAATEAENPAYNEQQLNAWGYNQGTINGQEAHDAGRPWLNQNLVNGNDIATNAGDLPYDPAAWNLKVIKLPSGGQIHVQYEQDDYQYVQDKQAHVMVPLVEAGSDDGNSPTYFLNTEAINVNTAEEKQALVDAIQKTYVETSKKMYFKMLYSMSPLNPLPDITDCDVEYIKGYIKIADAQLVGSPGAEKVYIDLATGQNGRTDLPKKVCQEYEKAFLSGKSLNSNCGINGDLSYEDNTDDPNGMVTQFINMMSTMPTPGQAEGCLNVDWENSYFRVPCIKPKKGGGIRVKRLMMYTPAIHDGEEPELYGTEYVYQFKDTDGNIKSSGVATNEPTTMREENILVDYIYRLPKNGWDKFRDFVTAGKEKEKYEGPIGESLYGSATVGYSQVITKNIHTGKTNTGYSVNQFHTCKDYPLIAEYTDLAGNTKNDYLPLPLLYVNQVTNNVWAAQGFRFEINDMHGKMKASAAYTGDYNNVVDFMNGNLVSSTQYEYFEVGENVPVMNSLEEIVDLPLGKETEMAMESRSTTDHLHDVNAEFDASVGLFGGIPVPMGSLFPSYKHVETELHTHVTNKIVRYPAMVKSVRNYTDGIYSKSENLAFNPQTGDPVITRTYDDFNRSDEAEQFEIDNNDHHGWFTSYAIPGYQEYANMGQVAYSEGKSFGSDGTAAGYMIDKLVYPDNSVKLSFYSAAGPIDVCDALNQLSTGDLIKLPGGLFHIAEIHGSEINLVPTYYNSGTQYSATDIQFIVVRSGKTNQAGANVGSFVTYGKSAALNSTLPEIVSLPLSDPAHPDNAAYLDRLALVSSLNGVLGSGGTITIPSGVVLDPQNPTNCTTEDATFDITIDGDGNYSITLSTSSGILTETFNSAMQGTVSATGPNLTTVRNASTGNSTSVILAKCGVSTPSPNYTVDRGFMTYDVSGIPPGVTIQDVTFGTNGSLTGTPFNIAVFKSNYSEPVDVAEYDAFTGIAIATFTASAASNAVILPNSVIDGSGEVKLCLRDEMFDVNGAGSPEISNSFYFANDAPHYLLVNYAFVSSCEMNLQSVIDGEFQINPENGALFYGTVGGDCDEQAVGCLEFCESLYPIKTVQNVITASASTLDDTWDYDESNYDNGIVNYNNFEMGKRGKWRVKSSYAYKASTTGLEERFNPYNVSTTDELFNYNSGVFSMALFNWKYEDANDPNAWLKATTVTKYSPDGNALEEKNILGIKSTVKFGYHEYLPYLVAGNASYESVVFESFENTYATPLGNVVEENIQILGGTVVVSEASHTGYSSLKFASGSVSPFFTSNEMEFTSQIANAGLHTKVWIKNLDANTENIQVTMSDVATGTNISGNMNKVAQTGEWTLYELNHSAWGSFNPATFTINFNIENSVVGKDIYVDDLRIQPMDTEMACYVYDYKNYRLMATFDDQHFSMLYQYNDEGQLTRKLIETTRGIKTVTDGQYHTPLKNRTN